MKPELSICFSTYGQSFMLAKWFEHYYAQPKPVRDQVEVIVVDDCGTPRAVIQKDHGVSLYRISIDRPWNQPGARNLAAHVATSRVLLLIDVDMTLGDGMLEKLVSAAHQLKPSHVLRPALKHVSTGKLDHTSPNVHLLLREDFLKIGYDESYAGRKGWSDVNLLRVMQRAFELRNREDLWLWFHSTTEAIPDAMVKTLDRDTSHNKKLHLKRMGQLAKMKWPEFVATVQAKPLQFPWLKVQ
jgi:glycosyltransferase involved in cell wall biosynthesis